MKKVIALLVLVFAPAIVAEESVQFKKIKEELYRHEGRLQAIGKFNDCKLVMLRQAFGNIDWRNYNKGYEKYSEKEVALQGIDIILNWADKSYVGKFGQTWQECEEQNRDLHRFVEELYDNEEVNKE